MGPKGKQAISGEGKRKRKGAPWDVVDRQFHDPMKPQAQIRGSRKFSGAKPNPDLRKPIFFVKSGALFHDEEEIFQPEMVENEADDAPTANQVESLFTKVPIAASETGAEAMDRKSRPRFADYSVAANLDDDGDIPTLEFGFSAEDLYTLGAQSLDTNPTSRLDKLLSDLSKTSLASGDGKSHIVVEASASTPLGDAQPSADAEGSTTLHIPQSNSDVQCPTADIPDAGDDIVVFTGTQPARVEVVATDPKHLSPPAGPEPSSPGRRVKRRSESLRKKALKHREEVHSTSGDTTDHRSCEIDSGPLVESELSSPENYMMSQLEGFLRRALKRRKTSHRLSVSNIENYLREGDSDIDWGSDSPLQNNASSSSNQLGVDDHGMIVDANFEGMDQLQFLADLNPENETATIGAADQEKPQDDEESDLSSGSSRSGDESVDNSDDGLGLSAEDEDVEADERQRGGDDSESELPRAKEPDEGEDGREKATVNVIMACPGSSMDNSERKVEDAGFALESAIMRTVQDLGTQGQNLAQREIVILGRLAKRVYQEVRKGGRTPKKIPRNATRQSLISWIQNQSLAEHKLEELRLVVEQFTARRDRKLERQKAARVGDSAWREVAEAGSLLPSRKTGKRKDKFGKRMYGDGREVQRELTETPEAHLHLESLLNEINAFIESPGKNSIKLPPMSKGDRKVVHFLANSCYHLATKSFGTEKTGRHVVLTRTPQTQTGRPRTRLLDRVLVAYQRGTFHQEGFIRASDTVRRKAKRKGSDVHPAEGGPEASKNSRKHVVLRPKEGDIVGRKAEPIGESNVGFQLLQRMGWSQGERIGATGGSTIPLPVVVKVSKLGLGTISYARPVSP